MHTVALLLPYTSYTFARGFTHVNVDFINIKVILLVGHSAFFRNKDTQRNFYTLGNLGCVINAWKLNKQTHIRINIIR